MGRVPSGLSAATATGAQAAGAEASRPADARADGAEASGTEAGGVASGAEAGGTEASGAEAGGLVVAEVFGPTFQGEGPSSGRRAGFVRLGRCNLDCSWCDTPYTWDWQRFDPAVELRREPVDALVSRLAAMAPEIVVVTGGEPLLQQRGLVPLARACHEHGWPVEVETNGTRAPDAALVPLVAQWNVSPKLANSGVAADRRVRPDALAALLATGRAVFKFVVEGEDDLDEVAEMVGAHDLRPVWVMPEGTDPATVLDGLRRLADPVLTRGWNLTSRLHVLLWGDERGR